MELNDITFSPHNDMSAEDIKIVTQHSNFISRKKFNAAAALLNSCNYTKGFRAALFNNIQNKIHDLEVYLLNEFAAAKDEYYSVNEPNEEFMQEHGYNFWIQPY